MCIPVLRRYTFTDLWFAETTSASITSAPFSVFILVLSRVSDPSPLARDRSTTFRRPRFYAQSECPLGFFF